MRLPNVFAAAIVAVVSGQAAAQFLVPEQTADGWTRGSTPLSIYAEWDFFSNPGPPADPEEASNIPDFEAVVGTLPPDAALFDAYDRDRETSFSFVTSSSLNIYSFSGVVAPEVIAPGFDLGYGFRTTVWFQTRVLGASADLGSFTLNERIEPLEVTVLSEGDSDSPFGGIEQDIFVLFETSRNDGVHTVNFQASGTSMSFDIGIIDTFTEMLPCAADIDLSGVVDFVDALAFLEDAAIDDADWNNDESTDATDVEQLLVELGSGCQP